RGVADRTGRAGGGAPAPARLARGPFPGDAARHDRPADSPDAPGGQAPRAKAGGAPAPGPRRQTPDGMIERPAFTLGVEEEFQIIDPETRQLRSHVQEMLEE